MTGIALGSGGAVGFGSIGVINYLQSKGIEFSEISGSSMGALIGAYLSVHGEVESLKEVAISQTKADIIKLIDLNNPKKSVIKGKHVEQFIRKYLKAKNFKETKIPLKVIATDIFRHEAVVFQKGDLIKALMASSSIPGIFPPVRYKDTFLVDGGIINPLPLEFLDSKKKLAVDFVPSNIKMKNLNVAETLKLSFFCMMKRVEEDILSKIDENTHVIKVDKVFQLNSMFAFYNAEQYIKVGELAARRDYKHIKRLIE